MTRAAGTRVSDFPTLQAAGEAAIARHSHFYTDAPGWLFRAFAHGDDILVHAYPVIRWTPLGATIRDIWGKGGGRWVNLDGAQSGHPFANRTVRDAVLDLNTRSLSSVVEFQNRMERAMRVADDTYRLLGEDAAKGGDNGLL